MGIDASRRESPVFLEEVEVLAQREYPRGQRVLCLRAPRCAGAAKPGQFIHLQCDRALRMRRPYSIMSASRERVEILYRVVGHGSRLLSRQRAGAVLSSLGPVGRGFTVRRERTKPLLLGGGVGIPPVLFLAQLLREDRAFSPFVVLASERPFPFSTRESEISVPGIDDGVRATHSTLEAHGTPARLCSTTPHSTGCFNGYAHQLAETWLSRLSAAEKSRVEIFACGPKPMLAAVAGLARKNRLPCQLAVEEYMACALGGCAGCVVPTVGPDGVAMKRVCVDGPVFEAGSLRF